MGGVPAMPPGFDWDYAVHVKGDSRWVNWYVEAVNWAATRGVTTPPDGHTIDGLYLDGMNYDRVTMKRVRKVLSRANPNSLIDFHCMQTFHNPYAQYGNTSVALNFMQHLPYIDNLWFGEGFSYGPATSKEHWLIEQSGILFGMYSEMLGGGGNPWKGMLFGETTRAPTQNNLPLYEFWDSVGFTRGLSICGWWQVGCPARTSLSAQVPLTTYSCASCGDGGKPIAVFALASFSESAPVNVSLAVNWSQLNLNPNELVLDAPGIAGLQAATSFQTDGVVTVQPEKGWLLVARKMQSGELLNFV